MIARKYRSLYFNEFLILAESLFQMRSARSQEIVVNESNLALYYDIDRHVVRSFLDEMVEQHLIEFTGHKRVFDDFQTEWSLRTYKLTPTNSQYCSKLQEYINQRCKWTPYLTDRFLVAEEYSDTLAKKKLDIAKQKLAENKKLTRAEKKMLQKQALNEIYKNDYAWAIDLLKDINASRPELFKSKYLAEGRNREVNILCGSLNPDREHVSASEEDLAERGILLTDFFGTEHFIENDTNGSIYRLTYALVYKRPLEHDVDVYKKVWQKAFYSIEFTKSIRNALKVLLMPIYMSNGSKNAWNSILAAKSGKMTKSEAARKSALNLLSQITSLTPKDVMDQLTAALRKFLGTSTFFEEEIFIHESNLHILMLTEFAKRGIKTINVYDGFYFVDGTCSKAEFNEVYDLCTRQLLAKMQ